MLWIKTLSLWTEAALCLSFFRLVIGMRTHVRGAEVLAPVSWDSLRCPRLMKFFSSMFYSGPTALSQCRGLWLAPPVPSGEPGPTGPGGQGLFKGRTQRHVALEPSITQVLSLTHRSPARSVRLACGADIPLYPPLVYHAMWFPCTPRMWLCILQNSEGWKRYISSP